MFYDGLVNYLIFKWCLRLSDLFNRTNKKYKKTSLSRRLNILCIIFKIIGFFPFYRTIMWSSLVKIQYTELKLCGNDPVVKNSIYSDLDLWPNDPKINRFLLLPQGNHVAKFGKDPIYRTKVIVRKPVWTPAIPNHIIRPVSRNLIIGSFNTTTKGMDTHHRKTFHTLI
jgi:hypothetical protein